MGNMERLWVFAISERIIAGLSAGAVTTIVGVEPCTGLDWITGCGSTINSVVASVILGTVSGAPDLFNVTFFVTFHGLVLIALLKWGRGVNDV